MVTAKPASRSAPANRFEPRPHHSAAHRNSHDKPIWINNISVSDIQEEAAPRSRQPSDFAFRIEVSRLPSEVVPGLGAAQPLVESVAACPVAELGGDGIGGDDKRLAPARLETASEGAGDAADRHPVDRRADI